MQKFRNLRNFAGCEISQLANFRNLRIFATCEFSQPANFRNLRIFANCENSHCDSTLLCTVYYVLFRHFVNIYIYKKIIIYIYIYIYINFGLQKYFYLFKKKKYRKFVKFFAGCEFSQPAPILPPDFISLITFSSELRFRCFWYHWKA